MKTHWKIVIVCLQLLLVLVLLSGTQAQATVNHFDEGVAAYNAGNYRKARKKFEPLAELGHAEAQFALGYIYYVGLSVPQDDKEAAKWYRKAAEQGNASAQHALGFLYRFGDGIPRDDKEAAKWYRKAAEQGNASAQHTLGFMYRVGDGIPRDDAEALKWIRKAADQGNFLAQFTLGSIYGKYAKLGSIYAKGWGVSQDLTESARWYRKAAEQGHAKAQLGLGSMYRFGKGVPKDLTESARWYRKAAEQGDANAQNNLGVTYLRGMGLPQDYTEAAKWFRRAAEQGDASAQQNFGEMYEKGQGVPQDYVLAHKWFNLSASHTQWWFHDVSIWKRNFIEKKMTRTQVAEAQKLASEWKAKNGMNDTVVIKKKFFHRGIPVPTKSQTRKVPSKSVAKPRSFNAKELFKEIHGSVVLITTFDSNNQPLAIGSGFYVDDGSKIVTNLHVISDAQVIRVKTQNGKIFRAKNVLGVDTERDLALLKSDESGKPIPLSQRVTEVGEDIIAIGNPKGLEATLSKGIVSGIRNDKGATVYQITAPISPGSSGGPIINVWGEVIGVSTFFYKEGQNLNFAVPSFYIRKLLKENPSAYTLK